MMANTDLSFGAVEVDHLNAVVVGVHPVEDALWDVQTQAVGPQHSFTGQEHVSVGAIHPSTLNFASLAFLRVLLPVCPVHPSKDNKRNATARQRWETISWGILRNLLALTEAMTFYLAAPKHTTLIRAFSDPQLICPQPNQSLCHQVLYDQSVFTTDPGTACALAVYNIVQN